MFIEYLSASSLNTYRECQFKYFLQKHLRIPELQQQTIHTTKGLAVHETLESWAKEEEKDYLLRLKQYYRENEHWKLDNRDPGKGFPHPYPKSCDTCPHAINLSGTTVCSIADKLIADVEGCPRPNFEDDLKLVEKEFAYANKPLSRKIVGVETPFDYTFSDMGFRILGYMDLVTEIDSDTMEVRDYKTGNWTKSYEEATKCLQLRIYSIAAKLKFPQYKYSVMTLDYLRKKPVSVIFSTDDDEATKKYLAEKFVEIQQNSEPARTKQFMCKYCVGYDKCGEYERKFKNAKGKFILPIYVPPEKKDDKDLRASELI